MNEQIGSMELSSYEMDWKLDKEKRCWYLENVVYVKKPQAIHLQCLSLFVPEIYRNADGSWNWEAECGGFTAKTAPMILENGIGGYAESSAKKIDRIGEAELAFLNAGMIYVSPGTRGKQSRDENGNMIGKSPAGLVDLKSAVRFLKHNRGMVPGDTGKIVSMGVSAGGAMSSLLGVTGNCEKYNEYLNDIGAVMDETDDIFASQCYCPIIDLEHADMAYEWMFRGISEYKGRLSQGSGMFTLNEFRMALSEKMADRYVDYFNGLGVKHPESGEVLILGRGGSVGGRKTVAAQGSADVYLLGILQSALDKYLNRKDAPEKSINEILTFADRTDGGFKIRSREEMIRSCLPRIKPCPSFDSLANDSAENQEFGCSDVDFMHFDAVIPEILAELEDDFPEECRGLKWKFENITEDEDLQKRIYLLNPFSFIGKEENVTVAPHFRIRVGTKDPHTSFTMAMILALKLKASGHKSVDYAMVWNAVHEKADYPGEFMDWVKEIAK